LVDDRQAGQVRYTLSDLPTQCLFGLACGYPDANDADRLAEEPIQKLLLGRDPVAGAPLVSQPTLSRTITTNWHRNRSRHEQCGLRRRL
jgi:hypothetical protein